MSKKSTLKEKIETKTALAETKPTSKLAELSKPITLEKIDDLLIFACPDCKNIHFRHAGYIELQVPYVQPDRKEKLSTDSHAVRVCTKCKHCFIWVNTKCYDVTKHIDLKAWETVEVQLHKATGPGGQC